MQRSIYIYMKITEELRGPVVQTINENEKVGKGQK